MSKSEKTFTFKQLDNKVSALVSLLESGRLKVKNSDMTLENLQSMYAESDKYLELFDRLKQLYLQSVVSVLDDKRFEYERSLYRYSKKSPDEINQILDSLELESRKGKTKYELPKFDIVDESVSQAQSLQSSESYQDDGLPY